MTKGSMKHNPNGESWEVTQVMDKVWDIYKIKMEGLSLRDKIA